MAACEPRATYANALDGVNVVSNPGSRLASRGQNSSPFSRTEDRRGPPPPEHPSKRPVLSADHRSASRTKMTGRRRYVDDHAGSTGAAGTGETYSSRRAIADRLSCGPASLVVGWLIVAVLGLVALLRLVASDSVEPLVVLDALTLIVYLPAWVVAVGGLIARRWWLAAAAAVIVAAQVAFVAPELLAAAPVPCVGSACPGGAGLRREHRQEPRLRGRLRASHRSRTALIS